MEKDLDRGSIPSRVIVTGLASTTRRLDAPRPRGEASKRGPERAEANLGIEDAGDLILGVFEEQAGGPVGCAGEGAGNFRRRQRFESRRR
jgi:hypothetical protein